jgi:hypothetical protein
MLSCNISFKVVPLGLTKQAYVFSNHFNSTSSNVLLLPTSYNFQWGFETRHSTGICANAIIIYVCHDNLNEVLSMFEP